MLGLGWGELLVILLIIIAIFGASRLAGIGSALGGSIREFKKAVRDENDKGEPKALPDAGPAKMEQAESEQKV